MRIKLFEMIFIVLIVSHSYAQESVSLKLGFKPNKIYHMSTEIISDSYVNFEGDSLVMAQIKQNGIQLPMKATGTQTIEQKIETGVMSSDNGIPFLMKIEKFESRIRMNGLEKNDSTKKVLENLEMEGIYHLDNTMTDIVVKGEGIPEYLKTTLTQMMGELLNKIKYPKKPIVIGDSFDQEIPLRLPIPNFGTMNMKVVSNYLLEKIEDGNSFFKVKSNLEILQNDPKITIEGEGEGDGTFIYNIENEFAQFYDADMDMTMKMKVNDLTVITKGKARTTMRCKIDQKN